MTLPEEYPDLARLLAEFFSLEGEALPERHDYRDTIAAFGMGESPDTIDEVVGDALLILSSSERLGEFEAALDELGYAFARQWHGVTPATWLAAVAEVLSRES